jgi:hypothetical protein
MPLDHSTKLYKDQKYTVSDAYFYILGHGFTVTQLEMNDPQGNEINVYFKRLPKQMYLPAVDPLRRTHVQLIIQNPWGLN